MPVRTIARGKEDLVTATPDTPATEIAQMMDDHTVGSVIVVEDDEPVGIVTDRDLAMEILNEDRDRELTASEFMSSDLVTADADDGVMELCRTMREHSVRRIPVVDDGKIAGIVTLDDVMVLLEDEMKNLSEVIRSESPPY